MQIKLLMQLLNRINLWLLLKQNPKVNLEIVFEPPMDFSSHQINNSQILFLFQHLLHYPYRLQPPLQYHHLDHLCHLRDYLKVGRWNSGLIMAKNGWIRTSEILFSSVQVARYLSNIGQIGLW